MLTEKEKLGVRAIISRLTPEDLYSLAFTVTKGYIKPENRDEAVQAVLLYCEKPSTLLRRKKVKKEVIFSYLRDEGVIVSVTGEKGDYIKICLKFWESLDNIQNDDMDMTFAEEKSPFFEENETAMPANTCSSPNQPTPHDAFCSLSPKDVVKMGHDFVVWFYTLLNQTSIGTPTNERFDTSHFTQDCSMTWLVKDANGCYNGNVASCAEVMQVFMEMVITKGIVLNPAVEAVVSCYDPYGIVRIKTGGVVYSMTNSVGLFEQVFALFRDPFQTDCWKIKRTDMSMQVNISLMQPVPPLQFGYGQNTPVCY